MTCVVVYRLRAIHGFGCDLSRAQALQLDLDSLDRAADAFRAAYTCMLARRGKRRE